MITTEAVLKALSYVDDPDLHKDLVTLNMVDNIVTGEHFVGFRLILTTPACPLKDQIKQACINAIHYFVDKEARVEVEITSRITSQRATTDTVLAGVKNIIAVASGKGGVGKSTVAVNLALGLAKQGATVGLIDADIHGPSIPTMLHLRNARPYVTQTPEGKQQIVPLEQYGIKTLSIGFLADERQAIVWRGPMVSSALRQFITDAAWGELDYLLLDLPPGTGDVHLTLAQIVPLTGAIIVTTPQDVAKADVIKSIAMFQLPQVNIPIIGIVENMSYFIPSDMPDKKYYIFGQGAGEQLAQEYQLTLLAQLPIEPSVAQRSDTGVPAVMGNDHVAQTYQDLAQTVARYIAIKNEQVLSNQNT
ncbi:MAG: Mrp/NBP35 family ATP-binding protein [Chitinophagales bacterium]|nr:Mrp/NBP35 family ATP-binding protein [Chitinophagales bacterium]